MNSVFHLDTFPDWNNDTDVMTTTIIHENQKSPKTRSAVILVSGFEPFGEETINPSMELLGILPDDLDGIHIEKILLPVSFHQAPVQLLESISQIQPGAILMLGQAAGRKPITVEKIAINWMKSQNADNDGWKPASEYGCKIDEQGADGLFSTAPAESMAEAIRKEGIDADLSLSAGGYVCNCIFYSALNALHEKGNLPISFIHLPLMDGQKKDEQDSRPVMKLEDMKTGILAALKVMVQEARR